MDTRIYSTPLGEERYKEYTDFLKKNGLRDEGDSDIIALITADNGRIAACGSLAGHTLKQFAVDSSLEGSGLMVEIMNKLIGEAYAAGCSRLFLCTKPANLNMMTSLGFYTLSRTDDAVLMENRRNGLGSFLESVRRSAEEFAKERGADIEKMDCAAVVCNCDPFTLGHRWLIEYAAEHSDFLYVFAVSERGSMFTPDERLGMIKAGTFDIDNCRVYESELYLVSRATFPAYFIRDEEHADEVKSDMDIALFSDRIAPALNIKKRYVGSEPFSPVTDAYNRRMKELLPGRGIELIEIPRLKTGSGSSSVAVSASRVRELLQSGDIEEVSALVPESSFDIIKDKIQSDK